MATVRREKMVVHDVPDPRSRWQLHQPATATKTSQQPDLARIEERIQRREIRGFLILLMELLFWVVKKELGCFHIALFLGVLYSDRKQLKKDREFRVQGDVEVSCVVSMLFIQLLFCDCMVLYCIYKILLYKDRNFREMDFWRQTARHIRPGPEDPRLLYLQDRHILEAVWQQHPNRVLRTRQHRALELLNLPVQIVPLLERTRFYGVAHVVLVTGRTNYMWSKLCLQLLGEAPPTDQLKGSRVNMTWFDERFSQVPENAMDVQLEQFTWGYIMRLLGCFLMPDTSGKLQSLIYLPLLENLDDVKKYSWGFTVLAYLYRSLCHATEYKEVERLEGVVPCIDATAAFVLWKPYDPSVCPQELIPDYCREEEEIWRVEVRLIHFNIVTIIIWDRAMLERNDCSRQVLLNSTHPSSQSIVGSLPTPIYHC
ncbi:serine/threonine-protein phosphatase 7 long form-like protein [Senna tora]|uniref:Serine/threonine-protein phosphatase 7 long form-like protein n=1 Tax=Senna tora TaxID=362788 RepID=A0A834WN45_9FABA|nr:serine/threonine-protein phosphatase 7 long form-like protein [Senna tora]